MSAHKAKDGEIKATFGTLPGQEKPDLIFAYGTGLIEDGTLVAQTLTPLWRELTLRGYDPKSLRFSVRKPKAPTKANTLTD